jgi:hypothetical protein
VFAMHENQQLFKVIISSWDLNVCLSDCIDTETTLR